MTEVDLECSEATVNIPVEEFILIPGPRWEWVILDPPYKLIRTDILKQYAGRQSLTGNTLLRNRLSLYFRARANNVLWLDYCTPMIKGFRRKKIWLCVPINYYENVRCLTWLKRSSPEFEL